VRRSVATTFIVEYRRTGPVATPWPPPTTALARACEGLDKRVLSRRSRQARRGAMSTDELARGIGMFRGLPPLAPTRTFSRGCCLSRRPRRREGEFDGDHSQRSGAKYEAEWVAGRIEVHAKAVPAGLGLRLCRAKGNDRFIASVEVIDVEVEV
jgi:hypothetical protein